MDKVELRAAIRRSPLTRWIADLEDATLFVGRWARGTATRGPLPALTKRAILVAALKHAELNAFVETGTFFGDTTHQFAKLGCTVYSVEVEPRLAALARRRFKDSANVHIVEGDSGTQLTNIIKALGAMPALFWLDGHFSAGPTGKGETDTPIMKELETILSLAAPASVVFVDDLWCFGVLPDYPKLEDVHRLLAARGAKDVATRDDLLQFSVPCRHQDRP